ncbi:hypothetical protein D5R81_12710 [Parashewanella spongiae]|uniref:Uncharacterized protein n=1 Tax=Parashewanella spongiae TaxID=342950 RepID=A0A3A6U6D5_9GAMM|nr:hypothetical protein [Parashewanella spongiae]MCL1078809.1 hypothetical protein [Parashewanella spongiae]RJY11939.1 hypothetical protein D5R81_12710 [Parashewanella spongiae]
MDTLPTVQSLLMQRSVFITGHQKFIDQFFEHVRERYFYTRIRELKTFTDPFNSLAKHIESHINAFRYLASEVDKENIYHIELEADFRITATIRSHNGTHKKLIYEKLNVNPSRAIHSIKALCRVLHNSPAFFICQKCHQLIDADFKAQNESCCTYNACNNMVKQPFSFCFVNRINGIYHDGIRAERDCEQIHVYLSRTEWPHPHQPKKVYEVIKTLPIHLTRKEVEHEVELLVDEIKPIKQCGHCEEKIHMDFMYNSMYCYDCATRVYNVVY